MRMCLLLAVLVTGSAGATTMRPFTTEGLVREAALVVRGTVVSERASFTPSRDRIYTDTTVHVREALVGRAGADIVVRQLGGTVGDVSALVPGTARFTRGEEVVLFLRTDGHFCYLVGMAQGKLSVGRRAGVEVLSRDLGGLHLLHGPAVARPSPPLGEGRTWESLRAEVRALVRGMKR